MHHTPGEWDKYTPGEVAAWKANEEVAEWLAAHPDSTIRCSYDGEDAE